jgi:hypothetical protein
LEKQKYRPPPPVAGAADLFLRATGLPFASFLGKKILDKRGKMCDNNS